MKKFPSVFCAEWLGLKRVFTLAALCVGLFLSVPAHSQTLGRISGIVTDSSGGAIANATVTVTDVQRGVPREVTTDSSGSYAAPNLVAGTYSVHVVFTGFQAVDRQNVQIGIGSDIHVDVSLQPGSQTQVVTVTEEAPAITTTHAQLEGIISGNALAELPFSGHNYVQLLALLPTFQLRPGAGAGPTAISSNGLPGDFNVYVLDGVPNQRPYLTTSGVNAGYSAGGPEQAVMLPTDAIQEFNVVGNGKAEFGWRPGAQLNIGIRSGANAIHGNAFALGRSTALMAQNPFFTAKSNTAFENFGGTFGGPIKKDKLFYLFGYEGQRYSVGNPKTATVPTTASGLGASSSLPDAINDLVAHGYCAPGGTCGHTISHLSLNLAGCVMTPVVQCTPDKGLFSNNTQSTTFPINFPTFGGTDNGVVRVDFHPNERHSFNGWYWEGLGEAVAPVSSVTQAYWSSPLLVHSRILRSWWTFVPNSNLVNDVRFGWDFSRSYNSGSYDCDARSGAPNYASLGFISGGTNCGFPAVTINGIGTGNVLAGAGGLDQRGFTTRILDNLSYTHGNHISKFGVEFVSYHLFIDSNTSGGKGTLAFNTTTTPSLNAFGTGSLCPTCTGAGLSTTPSGLENFLAGTTATGTILTGTVPREYTNRAFAMFAQDDWRVLPRLTLNLGLRYEYTFPIREVNNQMGNLDLNSPSGMCQQGVSGCTFYHLVASDISPRFGLAWDVTGKGKTVVRTSFNIIYEQPWVQHFIASNANLASMPTGLPMSCSPPVCSPARVVTTPGGTINFASFTINPTAASPIPWAVNTPAFANYASAAASCTNTQPCSIQGVASRLAYPMVVNWNVGLQHAITNNLTLEVDYVGNHGQHLFGTDDINRPTPGSNTKAAETSRRPFTANGQFPWFAGMTVFGTRANWSNYNALQMQARQRAFRGLTLLATYTFAHALASADARDPNSPLSEYGNTTGDIRHRFTFGPSYLLPGVKGYWQMLEGWQITSTLSVYSKRPVNATDSSNDLSGTGQGGDRWSLVGNADDFQLGGRTTVPCFAASSAQLTGTGISGSSAFKNACTAGLPQACLTAAAAEQTGPGGTTGTASVLSLGCYMMGNSVIVPPATGTFGTMGLFMLRAKPYSEWDMSVIKTWKLTEKVSTQFRTEIYNVTNSVKFGDPAATLSSPSSFGQSSATPDVNANSPIVGTGGPRKFQLGLKFLF